MGKDEDKQEKKNSSHIGMGQKVITSQPQNFLVFSLKINYNNLHIK